MEQKDFTITPAKSVIHEEMEKRIRAIVREEIAAHEERQVKCIVTSIAEGKSIRPLSL